MTTCRRDALLLTLVALLTACGGVSKVERDAVVAYSDAIRPLGFEGGRIVIELVRPGIRDLQAGKVTPEEFRSRAAGWRSGLEQIRRQFAAVRAPKGLGKAADLFDEALAGYLEAIEGFVGASFAGGTGRDAALDAAVDIAEQADKTYDRARTLLKTELARVGEPDRLTV